MINTIQKILNIPQANYNEAKIHSAEIDRLLGYQCLYLESKLAKTYEPNEIHAQENPKQKWIGLDIQSMQTPYSEILQIVSFIQPKEHDHWIDIGAAYGRIGVVLGLTHPSMRFTGYEIVKERTDEANRIFQKWSFHNAQIYTLDLADDNHPLPMAELYFIYDFGSKKDIAAVLEKLRLLALEKPIQVIARGRGIKNWIMMDHPWLCQITAPNHFEHWSHFRS